MSDPDQQRAVYMLRIAAEYIQNHCPYETIIYDDAECDGSCVADDCLAIADDLERLVF